MQFTNNNHVGVIKLTANDDPLINVRNASASADDVTGKIGTVTSAWFASSNPAGIEIASVVTHRQNFDINLSGDLSAATGMIIAFNLLPVAP